MSNISEAELQKLGDDIYLDKLIKLSKMVSDGKLSEGAAREIYKDISQHHNLVMKKVIATYKEASNA